MKALWAIVVCTSLALTVTAAAEISIRVYRCDGQTPLSLKDPNTPGVYSDIMTGTRLVFLISSNVSAGWYGGLLLTEQDWERGQLVGRGADPNFPLSTYWDSPLEAAGVRPSAEFAEYPFGDFARIGIDLIADRYAIPGDWFILDYYADQVGPCAVDLFDYAISMDVPQRTFTFTHVPSRDFNTDRRVNFKDFALCASEWRQKSPAAADTVPPSAFDLDADGITGPADIALFSEYWLERTDCNAPSAEPDPGAAGS